MAKKYVQHKVEAEEHEQRVQWCTFHPEYGYEHFIEGYRPELSADNQLAFKLKSGVFKETCKHARGEWEKAKVEADAPKFYLIIDEINRGDIPRIFGELITLIEADKRGKTVTLSTGNKFDVPPNVYIIATMNTADRSIALLDTALRRRFGFHELKPDSSVFEKVGLQFSVPTSGKSLAKWFDELNEKLATVLKEKRHDAEHILIGHSYFLQLTNLESDEEKNRRFTQIIRHEILPLIQEYCYEDATARKTLANWIKDTTGIDTDSAASDEVSSA